MLWMCLVVAGMTWVSLVSRVPLMLLLRLTLLLLVSYDQIMRHRLAHGTREDDGQRLLLALRLQRHLLCRRCGALPRHAAQPAVRMAARRHRRSIKDAVVDLQVVEVLVEGGLGRLLLRRIGLGLVRSRARNSPISPSKTPRLSI
jgi:hypothetical protein